MPVERVVKVMAGDTLEALWCLPDGTTHVERYTCPPREVVQARERQAGNAQATELADGRHVVPREL